MTKNILVLGGTRFFGKHLVHTLLDQGMTVTIATRGKTADDFGTKVKRLVFDREDEASIKAVLTKESYDVIYDNIAYTSNDIEILMRHVKTKRYIVTSSMSVYPQLHNDLVEADFDPQARPYQLVTFDQVNYAEGKRHVEEILSQKYSANSVFVRFPYVIGMDDYTKRFSFYIESVCQKKAMAIDNLDQQMSFIDSKEAGNFLAFLATSSFTGPINGAAKGTISLAEILAYVSSKTGLTPAFSDSGESGKYNGTPEYSINVELADKIGFHFSSLSDWIYQLCDQEIERWNKQ
jgi:nucleoside-diphosphate-sugar epimerase